MKCDSLIHWCRKSILFVKKYNDAIDRYGIQWLWCLWLFVIGQPVKAVRDIYSMMTILRVKLLPDVDIFSRLRAVPRDSPFLYSGSRETNDDAWCCVKMIHDYSLVTEVLVICVKLIPIEKWLHCLIKSNVYSMTRNRNDPILEELLKYDLYVWEAEMQYINHPMAKKAGGVKWRNEKQHQQQNSNGNNNIAVISYQ